MWVEQHASLTNRFAVKPYYDGHMCIGLLLFMGCWDHHDIGEQRSCDG